MRKPPRRRSGVAFWSVTNLPLLDRKSDPRHYSGRTPILQDHREKKRSKNVPQRRRQSDRNDRETLEKMRSFHPAPGAGVDGPLVSTTTPSPSGFPNSLTPPALNNDNHIPVWALTGDAVKAVAATAALQIGEKPAYAFTFNLTAQAEQKALGHPAGFLDSLKRSFDKQLGKAGLSLPYWFAVDVEKRRLHLHGTFGADPDQLQLLKEIMWASWGKWPGAGLQFQIKIDRLRDDGWATYSLRNRRRVVKIIGPRTFTITRPLQNDARWTYEDIRRIMRREII